MRKPFLAVGFIIGLMLLYCAWLGYFLRDPLTNVMPPHMPRGDIAAVILSGDMGFHVGMGPKIAERLNAEGIAVVGVNSLTYFRTTRTPAEATGLIERAMRRARKLTHARRIVLIGQSFGADMLHVGLAGLPDAYRRQVAMVALVVPGATVEYRASPAEMFTFAMPEEDARPTGGRLVWTPLLCVYGREEPASLCPLLRQPNARIVPLPGGHLLRYDADAVFAAIRGAMARVGVSPGKAGLI